MAKIILEAGDIVTTTVGFGVYLDDHRVLEIYDSKNNDGTLVGISSRQEVDVELMPKSDIQKILTQDKMIIDAILLTLNLPPRFGFGLKGVREEDVEDK